MRKTNTIFTTVLVTIAIFFFALDARAQNGVSGYTSIDYDPFTNTVYAYSETYEEYDVNLEYTAYVTLYVYDQNGSIMGYDVGSDNGTVGYAIAEVTFSGSPGATYTAQGYHKANASLWDYDYTYWPFVSIFYWDTFNFGFFEGNQVVTPFYHRFLGPGPQVTRESAPILLGRTTDTDSVTIPGGNPLLFITAKIYQGAQASFTDIAGRPTAQLAGTAGNCDPYSTFTLTVTYGPPEETRELRVTAKGFGNSSVSNWYVHPESINNNYNVTASPPTGTVSMIVNNKNGGQTNAQYDSIQVSVKGTYSSGQPISNVGKVRIQCP